MLQTFIITFFIILLCIIAMIITSFLNGKEMPGSCNNNKSNPCNCTLKDKIKCSLENNQILKS